MKKSILSLAIVIGLSFAAQSQFVFTATSASYSGSGAPATGNGAFYSYQPGYGAGNYVDNTCTTPSNTTPSSPDQLGGFDPAVFDAATANPSRPGTIFYGGAIRTMYSGTPCVGATPGFGFTFNNGQVVDLSLTENQKVQFTYMNNTGTDLNVEVQLFDKPSYTAKLTSFPYTFLADATSHTVVLDLSSNIAPSADMSNIAQVSFNYPFSVKSPDFGLSFADINIGSSVTGTNSAQSLVASSSVYPNPSNDMVNVIVNLKSVSDVKVTLSDMMGKEMMTITEGNMSSVNANINVANLNKGVYTVNYFINGSAAKSELLMVK